jgi:hypothetical protein
MQSVVVRYVWLTNDDGTNVKKCDNLKNIPHTLKHARANEFLDTKQPRPDATTGRDRRDENPSQKNILTEESPVLFAFSDDGFCHSNVDRCLQGGRGFSSCCCRRHGTVFADRCLGAGDARPRVSCTLRGYDGY